MSQAQAVVCPYTHLYYTFVGEQQCLLSALPPTLPPNNSTAHSRDPYPGQGVANPVSAERNVRY